jgi:hypothetical protein
MAPLASDVEPAFDGHESELEQYRSISVTAIVAAVLGLLSPLAMLHPVLWSIPLAGIAVALTAFRQLKTDGDQLTGRKAALLGLALCLIFGAASTARYFGRGYFVRREAHQLAMEWLGYLQANDRLKAHQWIYDPGMRAPLDDALPAYYERNPDQQKSLADFVAAEPVRSLLALSKDATITPLGVIDHTTEGARDIIIEQFHIVDPQAPTNKDYYLQVALNRTQYTRLAPPGWAVGKSSRTLNPE